MRNGTWTVTEALLEDRNILQSVVNCTDNGDVVRIPPAVLFQPQHRIVVRANITIEAITHQSGDRLSDAARKAWLTCPSGEGLFLIR